MSLLDLLTSIAALQTCFILFNFSYLLFWNYKIFFLLSRKLKKEGYTILSIQGQSEANWVLVDAGDVIIHLFRPEVRDFYNLDKMWLTPQDGIEI